jgi:hypothetical protein
MMIGMRLLYPLDVYSSFFPTQMMLEEAAALSDERQWLAQVLTKQLVREEDRNKQLTAQLADDLVDNRREVAAAASSQGQPHHSVTKAPPAISENDETARQTEPDKTRRRVS